MPSGSVWVGAPSSCCQASSWLCDLPSFTAECAWMTFMRTIWKSWSSQGQLTCSECLEQSSGTSGSFLTYLSLSSTEDDTRMSTQPLSLFSQSGLAPSSMQQDCSRDSGFFQQKRLLSVTDTPTPTSQMYRPSCATSIKSHLHTLSSLCHCYIVTGFQFLHYTSAT